MTVDVAVNFDALMAAGVDDQACRYAERDAILYAFGTGFGQAAGSREELPFLHEAAGLRTVPTMAGILPAYDFLAESGCDPSRATVTEQKLDLFRPLPGSAELRIDSRVVAVLDHGQPNGASVLVETEARMARDSTVLFQLASTLLAASNGHIPAPADNGPLPHRLPERDADMLCNLACAASQPLLFRLAGERGLRRGTGRRVGGAAPGPRALDAQCVAGIVCRAILKTICEYDFTLISGFDCRFTAPVIAGDVLTTEMWQERNIVSFRARVRDRIVVDNGKCTLAT